MGTYLGLASSTNERYVATKLGNVVRSRSVCRVIEKNRWSAAAVLGVAGAPSSHAPTGQEDIDAALEEKQDLHDRIGRRRSSSTTC